MTAGELEFSTPSAVIDRRYSKELRDIFFMRSLLEEGTTFG